jgi:hypothetical protein
MNGVLIILDIVGTAQGHLMRANYWKSRSPEQNRAIDD